jgi:hypothetical protein
MSWGATQDPVNGVYLAAVERIVRLAREVDSRRRVRTCRMCGCWFLPPANLVHAEDCSSCYQRERRLMEESVDAEEYRRYVEINGTFAERQRNAPPSSPIPAAAPQEKKRAAAPDQQSLFGDAA